MKKTVSANLSGLVFIFDEDAYQKLQSYLDQVRSYFAQSEGCDEIMADIENRIAEILAEKVNDRKEVISISEIEEVIVHMGRPEQYVDPGENEHQTADEQEHDQHQNPGKKKTKRLYRDTEGRVLAGVCAGVAYYFGWDPALVRVAFVIFFFFTGLGLPVYIILWIAVPEARTRSERLEMKGEPITAKNIGDAVNDELNNIKNTIRDVKDGDQIKNAGKKAGALLTSIFDFLGHVFYYIFKFFAKAFGILIFIAGLMGLCLLVAYFTGQFDLISFTKDGAFYVDIDVLSRLFFTTGRQAFLGLWGILLVTCIPVVALVYSGLRLLFGFRKDLRIVGLILVSLWIIGLMMTIVSFTSVARSFLVENSITDSVLLQGLQNDTLIVGMMDERDKALTVDRYSLWISEENDTIALPGLRLNITASTDSSTHLFIQKRAKGSTRTNALERAENIDVPFEYNGHKLKLASFYQMAIDDHWRDQGCNLVLSIPNGRSVYLEEGLSEILYDVSNTTNTWDRDMVNTVWTMTEYGLSKQVNEWESSEKDTIVH